MSELKSHYPIHFVNGKMQPPEPKEDVNLPTKPSSPTKDLAPLLVLKPPELPLLAFNTNTDMPLVLKPVEKDMPILNLKPTSPVQNGLVTRSEVGTEDDKNRYTITINSCDKNGLVNGITINIPSKDT